MAFFQLEDENLEDVLNDKYPFLVEAMEREDIKLHSGDATIFNEINVKDDEVIGFATFYLDESLTFYLTNIFILPEFRHKGLFYNLFDAMYSSGSSFGIYNPPRSVVELLIKFGFAKLVSDNIVISAIDFILDYDDLLSSSKEINVDEDSFISCFVYDLNICSPIVLNNISTPGVCDILYSKPLYSDIKDFDCLSARKDLNLDYFIGIKNLFLDNHTSFIDDLEELRDNLPSSYMNIYELLGEGDELSDYLKDMIDKTDVSYERIVEIRKQLFAEFEEGEVSTEGLLTRLNFLAFEQMDMEGEFNIQSMFDALKEGLRLCPYCFSNVHPLDSSCGTCGFNLEYIPELDDFDDFEDEDDGLNLSLTEETLQMLGHKFEEVSPTSITKRFDDVELDYRLFDALFLFEKGLPLSLACEDFHFKPEHVYVEFIKNGLINKGFISDKIDNDNWGLVADNYNIDGLKGILRENGLKVSGKKQVLIDRIGENVDIDWYWPDYFVTAKGFEFLNRKGLSYYFVNYLRFTDFDEFRSFWEDTFGEFGEDTVLRFINLKEIEYFNAKRQGDYLDNLYRKSFYYADVGMFEEALFESLHYFVSVMNPFEVSIDLDGAKRCIKNIRSLMDKLGLDSVEECFNRVYSGVDNVLNVPCDVCFDYLCRCLDDGFMVKTAEPIIKEYFVSSDASVSSGQSNLFDF